jgi:hypothetical protein
MKHPQSDESAWQACVVRDREVTGMGWIIAGELRFMHQRQSLSRCWARWRPSIRHARDGSATGGARRKGGRSDDGCPARYPIAEPTRSAGSPVRVFGALPNRDLPPVAACVMGVQNITDNPHPRISQ